MAHLFSSLKLIVTKSIRQYLLSTIITAISVALAAGLLMAVFSIQSQAYSAFTGGPFGFDAVLGARGSKIQLVLNTVFHLETSPGNIPYKVYQEIKKDKRIITAIPYVLGDNYMGFPIVGTIEDIFTKFEYQKHRKFQIAPGGRYFDHRRNEAVIGSFVAQKTGLKVGSKFNPTHGTVHSEELKHEALYHVVGVLKPTNSPSDRAIWIPVDGMYRLEGHVLRGAGKLYIPKDHEPIPDEHKELCAVLLKLKSPQAGFHLDQKYNKQGTTATRAWPIGAVMAKLFNRIGWMNKILAFICYLIIGVASGSILTSVYNTINERRREFAILRAIGSRKKVLFSAIIIQCMTIAGIGSILAYLVYWIIMGVASFILRAQTGVVLNIWQFHPVLILTPMGMIILGALAGILPAVRAYSTDVATNIVSDS